MIKNKTLIIGYGVQGKKRSKFLKSNSFITLDKESKSDFSELNKVPLRSYKNVFICTPDSQKNKIINFCIKNNKNILVEKPLAIEKKVKILSKILKKKKLKLYTAYNHRFEPHIEKTKKILEKKKLGKIYYMKIFYGNGTAKLVKHSWRDYPEGIIWDLGSHLLDLAYYFFGRQCGKFFIETKKNFENKNSDFVILSNRKSKIKIHLEMTYCMWKNSFRLNIVGKKGALSIDNLCKWGPSKLEINKRIFPSGVPSIKSSILNIKDPTWKLEHNFFNKLKNNDYNLQRDHWISHQIKNLKKK